MRQPGLVVVFAMMVVATGSMPAAAQTANATLNVSINGLARFTVSSTSISFSDADPDTVPNVTASPGPLTLTAKARTSLNGTVTLTVRASGPLRSGLQTIVASNLTWTATGAGFAAGTVSSTAATSVASWTGSGVRTGTQTYLFKNLWTYATGTYTVTLTYTLTAA